jgi:hypothetical protein
VVDSLVFTDRGYCVIIEHDCQIFLGQSSCRVRNEQACCFDGVIAEDDQFDLCEDSLAVILLGDASYRPER